MLKLGWFSTGRGEGSRNLLTTIHDAIQRGQIKTQIEFVFSNREPGEADGSDRFFQLVHEFDLDLVYFSSKRFRKQWPGAPDEWRLSYDQEVMHLLQPFQPDLCVLAGYMLIVGEKMCSRYTIINLHPAAPDGPVGTWQEVIWDIIETRASHSGVKIHLVTPELDQGPTLTYCTYPITGREVDDHWESIKGRKVAELKSKEGEDLPLFKLIRQQGMRRELPLMVKTLKSIAEGGISLDRNRSIKPHDLTEKIEGR